MADSATWKRVVIGTSAVVATAAAAYYIWKRKEASKAPVLEHKIFSAASLRQFCQATFEHFGVPAEDAALAADVLAEADLRGIESHGIARLHTYFELLTVGRINPTPNVRVISGEGKAVATVDGDNGLGLVVGPKANEIAMQRAREHGCGFVSVCNTNHFGIAGWYVTKAADQGMIGMSMTNTTKLVAPARGADRMLGTNPIAVGFPTRDQPQVIVDMATSAAAFGKVEIKNRLGRRLPIGWAIDKDGRPTDDPQRMFADGALMPLGSTEELSRHKGYCLGAWVDIMCAVLSGARWGPHAPPFTIRSGVNADGAQSRPEIGRGIGHFFGAWDVGGFMPLERFQARMDEWVECFRATRPAPGFDRVLVPGEPEHIAKRERAERGIPLPPAVVEDMEDIADKCGIDLPVHIDTIMK